jgi:hypothetical protein
VKEPNSDIANALDAAGIVWSWEYPGNIAIEAVPDVIVLTGSQGYEYGSGLDMATGREFPAEPTAPTGAAWVDWVTAFREGYISARERLAAPF